MADRFTPGTMAWVRVRVKRPAAIYGCGRKSECEVIDLSGRVVDAGYIYVDEDALIVNSVGVTAQERERRVEPPAARKPGEDRW